MFRMTTTMLKIPSAEPNFEYAMAWYRIAQNLGLFPRDLIKLIGKYCVVYEHTEKFQLVKSFVKLHQLSFRVSEKELGDQITIRSECVVLTCVKSFVNKGETEVHVVSDEHIIVGTDVVFFDTFYRVVSKDSNILRLDRPLISALERGWPVHGCLHFFKDFILSRTGVHELRLVKRAPTNIILEYTTKHKSYKEVWVDIETIH